MITSCHDVPAPWSMKAAVFVGTFVRITGLPVPDDLRGLADIDDSGVPDEH